MTTEGRKGRPTDLREACVQEALAIIGESGVESLSLRDVARRLGVSHQAPYKHYPSRDHILAEIVSRSFSAFAQYLDERSKTGDPRGDLREMGRAYLGYAIAQPLHYRLMFGTPLPDPRQHPEMMGRARHTFALLRTDIARLPGRPAESYSDRSLDLDALFVWSVMHGLASILQSHVLKTLDLAPEVLEAAISHALARIGTALGVRAPEGEPIPP